MVFGEVTELGDLFETLKDQLDLLAITITLEDLPKALVAFRS
jgi:hypothetical protein